MSETSSIQAKRNRKQFCTVKLITHVRQVTFFNPFAPEPPVTARADPGPFYPSTLTVKDNFLRTRVQSEEIFQTIPE